MFGPPSDVDGECNARLHIADDYGDNEATMRCHLEPNHDGLHEEKFGSRKVIVQWEEDERELEEEIENSTQR
ncbi:hypothetical protein LCGC14_2487520 [marine sediment metagenome]|uniref:Uncharacterized protein n=1 Tax=marine sediment metagenome TaxID=412755 RepID=A0A0F9B6L2_9ZZZZ